MNISTSQKVEARNTPMPNLPPGSPFEEFFEEFFKNRRGPGGPEAGPNRPPRRVSSLGSGFVVDSSGIVITNNHVIAESDEITVIFTDGARLKAEVVGRDTKTDLAVLRVKPAKPLKAVKFGDSDKLRLGEWVIAIGNPFQPRRLGDRGHRFRAQPRHQFGSLRQLHPDRRRHQSRQFGRAAVQPRRRCHRRQHRDHLALRRLDRHRLCGALEGRADGDCQLQQFGEIRRGWLGVKIQQVTDEIAESLNLKPVRGALVAGVDDKGPAKPAGIEAGDVIVKFDGKDIKEMRDLPRIVADTPVGKDVEVTIVRKGKEEKKTVKLGRLDDAEKPQPASVKATPPEEKSVVQKALGLGLAGMTDDLRKKFSIKEAVKGVVVTDVDSSSVAADKRLVPGSVIVAIEQEQMGAPADVVNKIDALKKAGKKTALLLVATAEGDMLFVALPID